MDSSSASSFDLAGGADTIVAPATPPGRGALAMVRVSGPRAAELVTRVCPGLDVAAVRRAQLVAIHDGSGAVLERAVAVRYAAPRSYTGEEMVELTVHGSPALVRRTVELLVDAGCRPARPGEFTRRAVANGKMDLLQAEAVADLIAAETGEQLGLARRQLDGALSRRVGGLRETMIALLARLEAVLDFVAQDLTVEVAELETLRREAVAGVEVLLATRRRGRLVRHGARVVLLGPPNAGKSTLFNRLLRSERAIVAPHPGTTRDFIEAEVELAGLRVTLVDTAGVGGAEDPIEREGVRRTLEVAGSADLVLALSPLGGEAAVVPEAAAALPVIDVRTKADLVPGAEVAAGAVVISALTGSGIEGLEERIASALREDWRGGEDPVAVNERHARALETAREALLRAPLGEPELAAEDVREALAALEELVGEVATDEVLDRVFATFCLGK